jgi:hypothetical protein
MAATPGGYSVAGCPKSPPASFSTRRNPQRTPEGTPPVSTRLRPCWTGFLNILSNLDSPLFPRQSSVGFDASLGLIARPHRPVEAYNVPIFGPPLVPLVGRQRHETAHISRLSAVVKDTTATRAGRLQFARSKASNPSHRCPTRPLRAHLALQRQWPVPCVSPLIPCTPHHVLN